MMFNVAIGTHLKIGVSSWKQTSTKLVIFHCHVSPRSEYEVLAVDGDIVILTKGCLVQDIKIGHE